MGTYQSLPERELWAMETRSFQQAKLGGSDEPALAGHVGLVTGAAGAIGSAICEALLTQGCHVVATDLPGEPLDSLVAELKRSFGCRAIGVPLDVTSSQVGQRGVYGSGPDLGRSRSGSGQCRPGARRTARRSGSRRVSTAGARQRGRDATRPGRSGPAFLPVRRSGGDIVVVSTKNVFAPGAGFGAYSATKAASHQLARIASLELADLDVRVNMVAPDAVFAHGTRRSGLWAAVGPDRMARSRSQTNRDWKIITAAGALLKVRVTAEDVSNAVLFFATRQTPTTGATIPVDAGLPDATPR